MNEFIYCIGNTFAADGLLSDAGAVGFYIAPYQRGYKWGSSTRYEAVPQILVDIFEGMAHDTKEYFLQYITLMPSKMNGNLVLEVIDGQQRLTTLSILFYCLEKWYNRKNGPPFDNIAKDKLEYSRYEKAASLFSDVVDFVDENGSNEAAYEEVESQDFYYMVKAAKCMRAFLDNLRDKELLDDYVDYLSNQVMLIVNLESGLVSAEEVFANLNDNKVGLTDDELIKGLLLTLGVRQSGSLGVHKHYKEIIDQRSVMGRMWDEISAWANQPAVSVYLFGQKEDGMKSLLSLIDLGANNAKGHEELEPFFNSFDNKGEKAEAQYELFNKFNESVTTPKQALEVLSQLKHAYLTLRGIFDNIDDAELYNMLGYSLFSAPIRNKSQRSELLKELLKLSKTGKIERLRKDLLERVPEMSKLKDANGEYKDLKYRSKNNKLTNLLLSFSVFPEDNSKSYRFDFFQYINSAWTFEHIFPQHPPKEIKFDNVGKQLIVNEIKRVYGKVIDEEADSSKKKEIEELRDDLIKKVNEGEKIEVSSGLDFLYQTELNDEQLDTCGNMALLPGATNASLSNNPYLIKRLILMDRIAKGHFVPKHTVDIFNKSLISKNNLFNVEITVWNIDDMKAHVEWMECRNEKILENLKSKRS